VQQQGSLWFVPGSHKRGIVEHFDASDFNPVGVAIGEYVIE
jgi:ectoine hydroxylase-related dioxygenase (phytanoyl-CoA dioxygenase family)